MQFAIRYPERCSALVLLVPIAWKPSDVPGPVAGLSRRAELLIRWLVGSDSVFWLALHLARNALIKRILATPPGLVMNASPSERSRIDEILRSVLPISKRAAGLKNDARIAGSLVRYELESIQAPTLVISLRDDLYGTFAGAQYTAQHIPGARFIGYERGGHLWVGHHDELIDQIASFAYEKDSS
jgi:pimeloyl-ACP methyl ester carboxylesterase